MKLTPQEKEKIYQKLKSNCVLSPNKLDYFSSVLKDAGVRHKQTKWNIFKLEYNKKFNKNNFKIFYNKIIKMFEDNENYEVYSDNDSDRSTAMLFSIK